MKALAVDLLLASTVLCAWLGCFAFLRLGTAFDKLHCTTFVNAAGLLLALAAFVEEGVTTRSAKLLVLVVLVLVTSAATTHAAGRALLLRDGPGR